jgi:uncharacterized protein YciI
MKTLFAVRRRHGFAWDESRSMRSQDGWIEHAAVMDRFVSEGLIVLGGPIGTGDETSRETLLLFAAESEAIVRRRLEEDPWTTSGHLEYVRIEPWLVLLDTRGVS